MTVSEIAMAMVAVVFLVNSVVMIYLLAPLSAALLDLVVTLTRESAVRSEASKAETACILYNIGTDWRDPARVLFMSVCRAFGMEAKESAIVKPGPQVLHPSGR